MQGCHPGIGVPRLSPALSQAAERLTPMCIEEIDVDQSLTETQPSSSDWRAEDYHRPIGPVARVLVFVAGEYGVSPLTLRQPQPKRYGPNIEAVHVARWLAASVSGKELTTVAGFFRCHHSCIHHSIRLIRSRRRSDDEFRGHTDDLLARAPRP